MFDRPLDLRKPGLFITATDTGVGKTVVTCAIAAAIRRQHEAQRPGRRLPRPVRVGVCKPMATGCRREREGLVCDDAEALATFADCREPLDIINPVRYVPAVAPAVAAQMTGQPVDRQAIARSLEWLDQRHDVLLVEGVGGLLVPIDGDDPSVTVLDLVKALDYPVVVVARANLGTLNHTAMTIRLLRQAGCTIAGLVINGFVADDWSPAQQPLRGGNPRREGPTLAPQALDEQAVRSAADLSMASNRTWLERMNRVPTLAVVPAVPAGEVAPALGRIPPTMLDAVALTYWMDVAQPPRHA